MTTSPLGTTTDKDVKSAHRAMWASGDYPALALRVIPDLGAALVEACAIAPGDKVLDVASGAGNAAIPAALAGASVVASDLTPEMFAVGREQAALRRAELTWERADAEALPFPDGEFDAVLSCVGVMFAPHHQQAADELVRVTRAKGTIGVLSWTPEGFVGEMLTAMKPYVAPSPKGAQPPPLWGSEGHLAQLFGERVVDVSIRRSMAVIDCFESPEDFRDYFKAHYGPCVACYRGIANEPGRVAALDADLAELARRHDRGGDRTVMDWEYLIYRARRRP